MNYDGANLSIKPLILRVFCGMLFWRMEVGLFFMPKNQAVSQTVEQHVNLRNIKRGGSCAYKNHIGMYRVQAA